MSQNVSVSKPYGAEKKGTQHQLVKSTAEAWCEEDPSRCV